MKGVDVNIFSATLKTHIAQGLFAARTITPTP